MRKTRVVAAGLVMALSGCDRDAAPPRQDPPPGLQGATYRLVRASNNPLPILLMVDSTCQHLLYGGTVEFEGGQSYRSEYDIRKICTDTSATVPDPGTRGTFQFRNDTAYFMGPAGAAGFGTLAGDSLIVSGPIHRLKYVKVTGQPDSTRR